VHSTAKFVVGTFVWLTQDDDPSLVWSAGGAGNGVKGNIKELKLVTAINPKTNQITIDTPIICTEWNPNLHPIASVDSGNSIVTGCGLESVYIDESSAKGGYATFMEESYG
jgi:hypothetical protein